MRKNIVRFLCLVLISAIMSACGSSSPDGASFVVTTQPTEPGSAFAQTIAPICEAAFQKTVDSGTPIKPVFFLLKRVYDNAGWTQLTDTFDESAITFPFVGVSNNSEVKSLVCIEEDRTLVAYYTPSGDPAYQSEWNVRLVSWPAGEVIGATTLTGLYPPTTKQYASGPKNGPSPRDDLLRWVLSSLGDTTVLVQLGVTGIAFSPDGTTLASSSGMMSVTIGNENTVKLWDMGTGNLVFTFDEDDDVENVAFSPDGKTIAFSLHKGVVKVVDIATKQELKSFDRYAFGRNAISFSLDGEAIAIGNWTSNVVELFDANTGELLRTFRGPTSGIDQLTFSTDGSVLAALDNNQTPHVWETATGDLIATSIIRSHFGYFSLAFSPDDKTLALSERTEDFQNAIRLFDVGTEKLKQTLVSRGQPIYSLAFSPDGRILASSAHFYEGTITLWDVETAKVIRTLTGHTEGVNALAFSPDGRILASASQDRTIKLWDITSGK